MVDVESSDIPPGSIDATLTDVTAPATCAPVLACWLHQSMSVVARLATAVGLGRR